MALWNPRTIRALFLPFEADLILKIPLSYTLPEDKLIWMGNKRGAFTVRSAYFVAVKILDTRVNGECSSGDPNSLIWRKIWSMKLPEKIKIFSWRACVNGLPLLTNMVAKGIQTPYTCPICDEEPESLIHGLISCEFALSVWSLWHDCPMDQLLKAKTFNDLVLHFCSSTSALFLELFFAISWSVWYNRNKLLHGETGLPPLQILEMAKSIVEDYREAFSLVSPSLPSAQSCWVAPPSGFLKVNVDGASSIDGSGTSGIGVIIRDDLGRIVAALSKALLVHYPTELTELFALEHGVLLAQELNVSNVIFDAASVISSVTQDCNGGAMGHLVHSIVSAKSVFSSYSFHHVKRTYNRAAHELAQFAKCNQVSNVWMGVTLPCLSHLFQFGLG